MLKIAVDWLINHGEVVIPVSYLTTIHGILDHLTSSSTKTQFIHGLLKGGGANLSSSSLKAFGQMVCSTFYPLVLKCNVTTCLWKYFDGSYCCSLRKRHHMPIILFYACTTVKRIHWYPWIPVFLTPLPSNTRLTI